MRIGNKVMKNITLVTKLYLKSILNAKSIISLKKYFGSGGSNTIKNVFFSLRCRTTLRGHADSVNSIQFLAYSNTLCTCSADKTISLWDARTGLCAQTFYGHMHSVNHASFNMQVSFSETLKFSID